MDATFLKDVTPGAMATSTPIPKGDKKREAGSPLETQQDVQKKTRHATDPDQNTSLPAINEIGTDNDNCANKEDEVHYLSYPLNPVDIAEIAKELRALMAVDIKSAVKEAVKEATNFLKVEIQELHTENARLQKANDELHSRVCQAEEINDALEQYSRRNSLRFSGIPEEADEQTDQVILGVANKLNIDIDLRDIDRSHRVGKVVTGIRNGNRRHRDIIVKFARYNVRDSVYKMRRELRNIPQLKSVYVNEDMTQKRAKLLFDARTLRRVNNIKAAYSSDGKIFIRDNSDNRHLIKSNADLDKFGNVEAAKNQLQLGSLNVH